MKSEHITLFLVEVIQGVKKRTALSFLFCMTISRARYPYIARVKSCPLNVRLMSVEPARIIIIRFHESQYRSDMQMKSDLTNKK